MPRVARARPAPPRTAVPRLVLPYPGFGFDKNLIENDGNVTSVATCCAKLRNDELVLVLSFFD